MFPKQLPWQWGLVYMIFFNALRYESIYPCVKWYLYVKIFSGQKGNVGPSEEWKFDLCAKWEMKTKNSETPCSVCFYHVYRAEKALTRVDKSNSYMYLHKVQLSIELRTSIWRLTQCGRRHNIDFKLSLEVYREVYPLHLTLLEVEEGVEAAVFDSQAWTILNLRCWEYTVLTLSKKEVWTSQFMGWISMIRNKGRY